MRIAGYVLFGAVLVFFNVIFDYARIRIVVEDRRSAIGAIAAGARFVRRHFGSGRRAVPAERRRLRAAGGALCGSSRPAHRATGIAMWRRCCSGRPTSSAVTI